MSTSFVPVSLDIICAWGYTEIGNGHKPFRFENTQGGVNPSNFKYRKEYEYGQV